MEKYCEEKINRNETRINDHSLRLKEVEKTQISIMKDNESFSDLLDKLEKTINSLNKTVATIDSLYREESYKNKDIDKKISKIYKDVEIIKSEDGDKWKYYSRLVIGGILTAALGYIMGGL